MLKKGFTVGIPEMDLEKEQLAQVSGPTKPPILQQTIGSKFAEIVKQFPQNIAVKAGSDEQLTYEALDQQSNSLALSLRNDLGINAGDRVAISLGNNIPYLVTIYACVKIGAISVPFNPAYTSDQTIAGLNHITAACFVTSSHITLPYKEPQTTVPLLQRLTNASTTANSQMPVPCLKHVVVVKDASTTLHLERSSISPVYIHDYDSIVCANRGRPLPLQDHLSPEDVINLQFTSGTTSAPKAVCLNHVNILNNAYFCARSLKVSEIFDGHDPCGMIGGSPIAPALRLELNKKMHLSGLVNVYGMTELSPAATMTTEEDTLTKMETSGRPIAHQSIKIVARDDASRTLLSGERGEILVSGMIMKGYWEDQYKTSQAFHVDYDGESDQPIVWMRTGDEGMIDQSGYLKITGRIKDIIIRGGENIYPVEIENILMQHPDIANASVVGIPDDKYGEVIAACVVLRDATKASCHGDSYARDLRSISQGQRNEHNQIDLSISELITPESCRSWVRARLSRHLVPKHIVFVTHLPLGATGKIDKPKVRDMAQLAFQPHTARVKSEFQVQPTKTHVVTDSSTRRFAVVRLLGVLKSMVRTIFVRVGLGL
ncbi:putative long-chain-fatty-acidligase [Phaeomoniella chlamydospora]|uniref:Putative long-chain-fatty-acidligase n=1 Tax=Phaeomoniella chlamydospora TaxID=158046 RepID=A0A0G2DV96_PHACM|nr:putative long-chain-fatty-acidligase [Phaeomoniella chlamydospora]